MIPYTDAEKINALINDATIRRWTLLGDKTLDLAESLTSGKALFFGDEHGGFLLHDEGSGIWSVHTQFLKGFRGSRVMSIARDAMEYMFQKTSCLAMSTFVEHGNRSAKALALGAGFNRVGEGEVEGHAGETFLFTVKDWARSLCQQSQ